jgi:hypothetical protein
MICYVTRPNTNVHARSASAPAHVFTRLLSSIVHARPNFSSLRRLRSKAQLFIFRTPELQRAVARAHQRECRAKVEPAQTLGTIYRTGPTWKFYQVIQFVNFGKLAVAGKRTPEAPGRAREHRVVLPPFWVKRRRATWMHEGTTWYEYLAPNAAAESLNLVPRVKFDISMR